MLPSGTLLTQHRQGYTFSLQHQEESDCSETSPGAAGDFKSPQISKCTEQEECCEAHCKTLTSSYRDGIAFVSEYEHVPEGP